MSKSMPSIKVRAVRFSGPRFLVHNAACDHESLPKVLRVGQPCTWRTLVIKVAAEIIQTTRRVIMRLASQWPWRPMYRDVSNRCLNFSPPTQ